MKKLVSFLMLAALSCSVQAQYLVSAQYSSTTSNSQLNLFTSAAVYDVVHYKILYNTTDVDGSSTVASGALLLPLATSCDSFPLVAYEHGTVLRKDEVPSRDNFEAIVPKVFASTGAVAVAPDYLGLGDNPGLHPYLHGESEATATLDLIRACREFLSDTLSYNLNGEVYVTGYSQGGHAAMATVKYAQEQNLLNEFNIIGAGPASGPYNLSGSQKDVLISNSPYSNPGYVVYLLFGLNRAYGNIFQNYSDILKSPYDTLIPPYFDGTYDMSVVNALLPDTLSGFLHDSVLTNFANDTLSKTHPIWQALLANDNYDWNPGFPIEMYYCTQDEQVNYQNALDAESAMQAYGANAKAVFKGNLNHSGCFLPSLQGALGMYTGLRTACQDVSLPGQEVQSLELYPNPADDYFQVKGTEALIQLQILDPTGKIIMKRQVQPGEAVNTGHLRSGIFLVKILTEAGEKIYKLRIY